MERIKKGKFTGGNVHCKKVVEITARITNVQGYGLKHSL